MSKNRRNIFKKRVTYKPTEYQRAEDYDDSQQNHHWIKTEIAMSTDIQEWNHGNLTAGEKTLIGNVLKGFTQTEVAVNDYWSNNVSQWFPKPEIAIMATTFAAFEGIHAKSYNMLNESLGFDDFSAFLEDETTKAKLDSISGFKKIKIKKNDLKNIVSLQKLYEDGKLKKFEELRESTKTYRKIMNIAKSLAIFSAFTEGVNLFSSFAILFSFSLKGSMRGIAKIVEFSVRDESLHSNAGCWLFNQIMSENPYIMKDESFKHEIYEAARLSTGLETDFIEKAFELIPDDMVLESKEDFDSILSKRHLINFIKYRVNSKLKQLNLNPIYDGLDEKMLLEMSWFNSLTSGEVFTDFFYDRVTSYTKGVGNFDPEYIFEGFDEYKN